MNTRTLLLCLAFSPLHFISFSQADSQPENAEKRPVRFEPIGAEQGLPHQTVRALFQDHLGFIWLGTPVGLVKYDGYTFKTFDYKKEEEDPAREKPIKITVMTIAEDPGGNLWIGCIVEESRESLILGFDRETEKFTRPFLVEGNRFGQNPRWNIHISNGFIWLATPHLFRVPLPPQGREGGSSDTLQVEPLGKGAYGLKRDVFADIYEDSKGRIWFPTRTGVQEWLPEVDSFRFHDMEVLQQVQQYGGVGFLHVLEAKDGWLWAFPAAWNFMVRFHPEKDLLETIDSDRILGGHMVEDFSGRLWFGKRGGRGEINIFDPANNLVESINIQLDKELFFPLARVMSMLHDYSGNIWVGTEYGPLLKYEPQRDQFHWLHYQAENETGLSHNHVTGFQEDKNGNYWIATFGGGLNYWDRQKNIFTHYRQRPGGSHGPLTDYTVGLDITNDGKVWFGEGSMVGAYDPVAGVFHHYETGKGGSTWSICKDIEGGFWITKDTGGLKYYDPATGQFVHVNLVNPEDTSRTIYYRMRSIYPDSRGDLWIGTFEAPNRGFLRFDPKREEVELFHYPEARSFCENTGYLWIGTIDGLYRYDLKTETFQHYRQEDGLPNNTIEGIQADGAGRLWMATGNGLSCFDPENESFRNYFQSDGLPANEFSTGSYKNSRGELFFGGKFGVLYFHPDSIRDNRIPPKLAFTGLDLFGQSLAIDEKEPLTKHISITQVVHFSHWQNDLTIHYAALHFKNPEMNSYKIKLDHYDSDWREAGHQNFATYTNLDPGQYTFHAIKFTPEYGKVTIIARQKTKAEGSELSVRVTDTGIGIASDELPNIFDRFHQVDAGPTRQAEGTGIGLALVKELVELMDGRIEVESEPGEGTTFEVLLPIRHTAPALDVHQQQAVQAAPSAGIRSSEVPGEEWSAVSATVTSVDPPLLLIVEDNQDVRQYLASCLRADYELLFARNGREGINQALEHIPDIIISDVMMPEIDGFELCRILKQDERSSHIPIILLTAKADMASRLEGLEFGADAYLVKPFHRSELDIRLRKLVELRRKLQAKYNQPSFVTETATEKEDAFIIKVRQLVMDHLDDSEFGIEELSRGLFLHRSQLHRKLKALTGRSASHFIRQIRLQEAYRLLQEGELNVTEAGYAVGFSDPSYFSKLFSQEFGRPPSKI